MAQCAYCKAETEMYVSGVPICIECSHSPQVKRKPPLTVDEIRTTLFRDVFEATALNEDATREFKATISQFPSGLPHPDGIQRIKNASDCLAVARKDKIKAHNRLNDFLGKGIVPDDLKRTI